MRSLIAEKMARLVRSHLDQSRPSMAILSEAFTLLFAEQIYAVFLQANAVLVGYIWAEKQVYAASTISRVISILCSKAIGIVSYTTTDKHARCRIRICNII